MWRLRSLVLSFWFKPPNVNIIQLQLTQSTMAASWPEDVSTKGHSGVNQLGGVFVSGISISGNLSFQVNMP